MMRCRFSNDRIRNFKRQLCQMAKRPKANVNDLRMKSHKPVKDIKIVNFILIPRLQNQT